MVKQNLSSLKLQLGVEQMNNILKEKIILEVKLQKIKIYRRLLVLNQMEQELVSIYYPRNNK